MTKDVPVHFGKHYAPPEASVLVYSRIPSSCGTSRQYVVKRPFETLLAMGDGPFETVLAYVKVLGGIAENATRFV